MSAPEVLVALLVERLGAAEGIAGAARVFDAPPVRAGRPYLVIDEPVVTDWGAKGCEARELRVTVTAHDAGERPARLRALAAAIERAVGGLPRELGEGWGLASVALLRARLRREGNERWVAASEWRVRMVR